MQIKQSTLTYPGRVVLQFELTEFEEAEIKEVEARSRKPVSSTIEAGINAADFLSAYEIFSLYVCRVTGGNPDRFLQGTRELYKKWVAAARG